MHRHDQAWKNGWSIYLRYSTRVMEVYHLQKIWVSLEAIFWTRAPIRVLTSDYDSPYFIWYRRAPPAVCGCWLHSTAPCKRPPEWKIDKNRKINFCSRAPIGDLTTDSCLTHRIWLGWPMERCLQYWQQIFPLRLIASPTKNDIGHRANFWTRAQIDIPISASCSE